MLSDSTSSGILPPDLPQILPQTGFEHTPIGGADSHLLIHNPQTSNTQQLPSIPSSETLSAESLSQIHDSETLHPDLSRHFDSQTAGADLIGVKEPKIAFNDSLTQHPETDAKGRIDIGKPNLANSQPLVDISNSPKAGRDPLTGAHDLKIPFKGDSLTDHHEQKAASTLCSLSPYRHVLLLSVDGLRQADIAAPSLQPDLSNIRSLAQTGVTYTNAFASKPSDSFPGTLAYLTGAGPKTTGVYYDNSYSRQLTAPGGTVSSPRGTEVLFDESIDKNPDLLSGGGNFGVGSIDPAKLPLDSTSGTSSPVYPHNYLKVNTIFEVAKAAGLHTAFSDKHPAYDLANGPSGTGIDDFYAPEIAAKVAIQNGKLVDASTAKNPRNLTFQGVTDSVTTTKAYDDLKVNAILNEIKGLNSLGTASPGVPALFGMNFQALSVAEKDPVGGIATNGTPSPEFADALKHTDTSIGQILNGLKENHLFNSTLVVLTAKHGQNPRLGSATLLPENTFTDPLKNAGIDVAHATQDDVSLLWLKDQTQASQAAKALEALKKNNPNSGINQVLFGKGLEQAGFGNPLKNERTPDLIVKLQPGFVVSDKPKRAEHGGFSKDDTHVALIVGSSGLSNSLQGTSQAGKVTTKQIAVTALDALKLDPNNLQGAKAEKTQVLPGVGLKKLNEPTKTGTEGKNVVIFVADGLRHSSVNPKDAPTLYAIQHHGVNFANSHSLFPTFTTPNAAAIATGHYLGDTGDFSNTIYTGYPVFSGGGNGTPTPFIENDQILGDIDEHFGGNFLSEETLLAYARQHGFSTAAVGKLGPTLIQDVTQGNPGSDGTAPVPSTIIVDDSTGKFDPDGKPLGVPLNRDIINRLVNAGLPATAPDRSNGLPAADPLNNSNSGNNTTPGTLSANVVQQQYFADAITKAILPSFKDAGNPFAMVYWSRDPDGSQHNQGDSLNSVTPGINGPTSKAAIKNADNNLKQIIQALKDQGLYNNTDIFVTSDHGFSTISRQLIDNQGHKVNDYASSQSYTGVNPGFLPPGFVAIDLAHKLGLPLYDPNTPILDNQSKPIAYTPVDPTTTPVDPTTVQRPVVGNGLIGGSGQIKDHPDAKVVVAANGGSDLIYLPNGNPTQANGKTLAENVVSFLTKQDYTSGVFVDQDKFGAIPGALPVSSINLKGSTQLPLPSIVLNFKTFATDSSNPTGSGVEIADTGLQQGQGMHGSFSRADTFNNMAAIGPDFKRHYADQAPVSNADVAITLANILGLDIPSKGNLKGRVLTEALAEGPESVPYSTGILKSEAAANGARTFLDYQQVGKTRYFDAAGFAGRTVGLTTSLQADGKDGQKTGSP